jgi:hypothetical protein
MKKLILILILTIICFSCERTFSSDYVIQNNCDTSISINVILWNDKTNHVVITAYKDSLIHRDKGLGNPYPPEEIFKSIIIMQRDNYSIKNWINKEYWTYYDTYDSNHELVGKWYLTINPEDFE